MPARSPFAGRYAPVGAVVFDDYWREHYTVLAHNPDGTVTVQWHGDGAGLNQREVRQTTHLTPMDERDVIVRWLPEPCSYCGWQYPQDLLDQAARGEVRLDPEPTHACTF